MEVEHLGGGTRLVTHAQPLYLLYLVLAGHDHKRTYSGMQSRSSSCSGRNCEAAAEVDAIREKRWCTNNFCWTGLLDSPKMFI